MNDGKFGSSFSCSSFRIPSSALLILCCILSLRTYKIKKHQYQNCDTTKLGEKSRTMGNLHSFINPNKHRLRAFSALMTKQT